MMHLNQNNMKPFVVNFIYAILLIALSLWGYMASESPSPTAFIPTAFGVLLLAFTPGMRKENKVCRVFIPASAQKG